MMTTPSAPMILLKSVSKYYRNPSGQCSALSNASFAVDKAEFVAIVGKSGSGKSTLLNLITGIDSPSSGEVLIAGTALQSMDQEDLIKWRGVNVGVIFQFFQLLPTLTVAENVMLPMDFCATFPAKERRARALMLLSKLGIIEHADKLPAELSGGQQQRAAIARALANDPQVLVADEPTGNLDSQTSDEVMQLFAQLVEEGKTVLMVTHERDYGHYFTRTICLADGCIISDTASASTELGEERRYA